MKKIIIVILIILIILTLLVYVISLAKKQPKLQPSPIPQMSPQPATSQPPDASSLKVISVYPPPDKLNKVSQGTRITVTFDQNIDTATFKYASNPPLEIATDFSTNSVIFRPKTFWPLDTKLTIAILYAKGNKGGILDSPYRIEFMSPAPTGM